MGGALGKLICAITGRETVEEVEHRKRADAALAGIAQAAQDISQVAAETRIWAEKVKKRETERKAEKARRASDSATQVAVSDNGNGEAA